MGRSGAKPARFDRRDPMRAAYLTLRKLEPAAGGFAASHARSRVLAQLDPEQVLEVARLLALAGGEEVGTQLLADLVRSEVAKANRRYAPGCVAGLLLRPLGIDIDAPATNHRELLEDLLPAVSASVADTGTVRGHLASVLRADDHFADAALVAQRLLAEVPLEQALQDAATTTAAADAAAREREFEWLARRFRVAGVAGGAGGLSRLWQRAVPGVSGGANCTPTPEAVLLRLRGARSDEDVVAAFAAAVQG